MMAVMLGEKWTITVVVIITVIVSLEIAKVVLLDFVKINQLNY